MSRCVSIKGRLNSDVIPLFLIADCAGPTASYISLPPLRPKHPVYAFEPPFLQSPLEYSYNFEEVGTAYVNVIQNICPTGPILVHSWSIDGIFAVEASR